MAGLGRLKTRFGTAVLVSPSRKSFLRSITGRDLPDIGPASLAAELYAASQRVDYIRGAPAATPSGACSARPSTSKCGSH
jgi:dihydropteroate synthase type 2